MDAVRLGSRRAPQQRVAARVVAARDMRAQSIARAEAEANTVAVRGGAGEEVHGAQNRRIATRMQDVDNANRTRYKRTMHTSKPARSQNLARAIALRFPPGVTAKLDALARQRTRDEGTLVT